MTKGSNGCKRTLVVKIGSSTLTTSASSIDADYLNMLASQLAALRDEGWRVVIVSSGAIACGLGALGISERPSDIPSLQASASVGQSKLAQAYADAFERYGILTSTVLLTRRDTADRDAYLHARDTFGRLLELDVIPVVNENDTVSIEQIRFGDNDTLAALVAVLVDADLLVIASDIAGLYDENPAHNPNACLIREVAHIDKAIVDVAGGAGSVAGSGGMQTKVRAARIMMAAGIPLAIVDGRAEDAIVATAHDECPGTLFKARESRHAITPRKLWVALGDSSRGILSIDDGARTALINNGSSLLPVGIRFVEGDFDVGDIVDITDSDGVVIARGIAGAPSDQLELACGKSKSELLGNRLLAELASKPIIHRDDCIVFE